MVNGYTALCVTKLDILDSLPELKLAVDYRLQGQVIQYFPSSATELESVEVRRFYFTFYRKVLFLIRALPW